MEFPVSPTIIDDLKKSSKPSAIGNKHAIDPKSAVKTIDGEDSVKWMKDWSLNGGSQDRDALYNQMLAGLPRVRHRRRGGFRYPGSVYPGDKTTLGFYNGTVRDFSNWSFFEVSFTSVKDGETFYDKFCTGRDDESGVN